MRPTNLLLALSLFILSFVVTADRRQASGDRNAELEAVRARLSALQAQPEEDWSFVQRTYPRFELPERVAEKIQQSATAFRKGQARNTPMASSPWTLIGPTNIGGRITGIAIHPTNPNIFYAAAASGGVWKTTNFGLTWANVFNESFSIGAVTLDPTDPSVVYVGTGESNPSSVDTYPGNGLWRSTDAGATWTNLGLAETGHIAKVAVNPLNPNTIYVAAFGLYRTKNVDKGVYRSFNRGASWTRVLQIDSTTGATDLQIDPDDTSRVLAATHTYYRTLPTVERGGAGSGLWTTTNAGSAWTQVTSGFPFNDANIGSISLDYSKSNPSIVYATVSGGGGFSWDGVYKSFDNGDTWGKVFDNAGTYGESQVWYNNILRIHPADPNKVWTGMTYMYQSTDGGASFGYAPTSGDYHVDHHAIEYAPSDNNKMVFGNDGGIFTSTNGGATWTHAGNLPITQFYAGTIAAQSVNYVMGGAQDNSTMRTRSSIDNDWDVILGGDGFNCAVDPTDSNYVYAEYQNGGLMRSTDGGSGWFGGTSGINFGEPVNWQMPFVLDPQNPKKLYAGTNYLYRSTDGAASWTKISPILTYNLVGWFSTLSTIDVSPVDSNIVYVGTGDGRLSVTTDGGFIWTDITAGLPLRWVSRVTADYTDPAVAYVTLSGFREYDNQGHIYRTTNNGASWTDIGASLPDVPLNDVLVDPDYPSMLYVASDIGVMASTDLGSTWADLGTGLPAVTVHDIHIHAPTRTIAAFTHGRSVYTTDLLISSGPSVDVEVQPRWNLVSNPIDTTGLPVIFDFPEAVSPAYAFDGSGYVTDDSLVPGRGYWLKFPNSPFSPVTISGTPLAADTIAVSAGWNIVGSIGSDVTVGSIESNPPGLVTSQFFGYASGYFNAATIEPGKGYWVKVSADGELILSAGAVTSPANRIVIEETQETPPAPPEAIAADDLAPREYKLEQNYPNPFNPSTKIRYTLPAAGPVRLVVTNLLGQGIAVLVDEQQGAGEHEAAFDAAGLPSGVYLYRITAAGFTQERKMLLMR
jgi:photosystem II stability/assembly factor-like uncharacterized protein